MQAIWNMLKICNYLATNLHEWTQTELESVEKIVDEHRAKPLRATGL